MEISQYFLLLGGLANSSPVAAVFLLSHAKTWLGADCEVVHTLKLTQYFIWLADDRGLRRGFHKILENSSLFFLLFSLSGKKTVASVA